ncbi:MULTISPECIES: DUF2721 domain-containing protein [Nostocales]|uniref:DUF2721 domain-containing protein n=3 Tax=Nostocales TaxID=1161 RepID=A0A0C1QTB7_9CYAN|nr:DUF2721 domain-containing protein [Tolypothrix bouteillei]KAF3883990.1 DUF2721 domain-containing protein [Tolypothrix bouteillei VB521301]
MSAETTARIIQTIIAPTVLITACAIILNGIIGQYNTIGSRLSSLAHERLELLQKNAFEDFLGRERLQEIDIQLPTLGHRYRLLQYTALIIHASVMIFLLTMVAIAISVSLSSQWFASSAVILFFSGILVLILGLLLIAIEIRISHKAVCYEVKRISALCNSMNWDSSYSAKE